MRRYLLLLLLFCAFGTACAYVHNQPAVSASGVSMEEEKHVLILDAGHGGMDGGAVSSGGVVESDLNLQITLKAYEICLFLGEEVRLTRTDSAALCDDSSATIREQKVSDTKNRVALINSYPQATLLSIHQNILPGYPDVQGAQVFYNRVAQADSLAQCIQNMLNYAVNCDNNKQIKKIPETVYMMKHAKCPAVLIECGFLSNREETALLQQDTYQIKLAAAIVSGYLTHRVGE